MLADELLDLVGFEIVERGVVEVQNDLGAARGRLFERQGRDGIGALAVRGPAVGVVAARAMGFDHDMVRHHEGGIESNAELADEIRADGWSFRPFGNGLAELVEKGAGAGTGDRAQGIGEIALRHADAVVGDGQGFCVLVERDRDAERLFVRRQRGMGDGLVA